MLRGLVIFCSTFFWRPTLGRRRSRAHPCARKAGVPTMIQSDADSDRRARNGRDGPAVMLKSFRLDQRYLRARVVSFADRVDGVGTIGSGKCPFGALSPVSKPTGSNPHSGRTIERLLVRSCSDSDAPPGRTDPDCRRNGEAQSGTSERVEKNHASSPDRPQSGSPMTVKGYRVPSSKH